MIVESKDKTIKAYVTNVQNKKLRVTQLDDRIMITFLFKNPESGPTDWVSITLSKDTIYSLHYYNKFMQGGSVSSPIKPTKSSQICKVTGFKDTITIEFSKPNKNQTYFLIT